MHTLFNPRGILKRAIQIVVRISLILPVFFQCHQAFAQSPATQATVITTLSPPFSVPLANLTSQQLRVMITPINGYIDDGKVSIIIQGNNGIRIQNNFLTDNYYLGIPEFSTYQLNDFDLQEIFMRSNFTFTGITEAQAFDSGLPPGNYEICVRVYASLMGYEPISPPAPIGCSSFIIQEPAPGSVTVTNFVTPPYTSSLQDYLNKINSTIVSTTHNSVRLHLAIKGSNGIVIQSRPGSITQEVITLSAGVPYMLNSFDLDPYFRFENLTFSGISANAVFNRGLPEGNYRFCIRIVDLKGNFISGDDPLGCSNLVNIHLFEPPQLINPLCGSQIKATTIQSIVFSWTPSPGAPPNVAYTLRLVEMLDPTKNPNDALLTATTPAFFETTVSGATVFLYGPAQPVLEPGRKYAWQVIAGLGSGADFGNNTNQFRNQGKSAVCSFTYEAADSPFATLPLSQTTSVSPYQGLPGYTEPLAYGEATVAPFIDNAGITGQLDHTFVFSQSQPVANTNVKLVLTYVKKTGSKEEIINDNYNGGGKVLATSKTDANGKFKFQFVINDLELPKTISSTININTGKPAGTIYRTARVVVENNYLLSPTKDITIEKNKTVDVGKCLAVVREYWLNVKLKQTDFFKEGATQAPLQNYTVYVLRQIRPNGVPSNEGTPPTPKATIKGMEVVGKGLSDKNGGAQFYRLVKNIGPNDKYFIYAEGKEENLTNFYSDPTPFAFNFEKTLSKYKAKQLSGDKIDNATFISEYEIPKVESTLLMKWRPGEIVGYVKRGDNPQKGISFAQVKLWEVPEKDNVIFHLLLAPPKYTRWSAIKPEGYFKIDKLLPTTKFNDNTKTLEFHSPYRFLKVSYYGFSDYKEAIPKILLGERKVLSDILLNPKGSLVGEVVNEQNQFVSAEVSVKNGNSVQTTLGGYETKPSGTSGWYLTWPTKSTFEVQAPLGKQKLTVIPTNKEAYLSYDTIINVTKDKQNAGIIKLYDKAFRIKVNVTEYINSSHGLYQLSSLQLPGQSQNPKPSGPKLIEGAKVSIQYIVPQPVLTNAQGFAQFKFKSMGGNFIIKVEAPDGQLYEATTATITKDQLPTPTKDYYEITIAMKKAAQISGKVMVGNTPITDAKVYIKTSTQGNAIPLQTNSNEQGEYVLKNVPLNTPIQVWAVKGQSQYIGDVKNLTLTKTLNENIDFELTQYNGIVLTELLGIPIEVSQLTEEGDKIKLTGAFINLPLAQNLSLENNQASLPFSQVEIIKSDKKNPDGIFYGKPVTGNVPLDASTLDLKLNNKLVLHQVAKDDELQITDNGQGKGYLEAPTYLNISTFQVNVAQFEKNELRLATGTGNNQKLNVTSISAVSANNINKYYIIADDGKNLDYKLHNFTMNALNNDSYIDGENLKLHSVLHTNLKNITQADLKLDVGQVLITQTAVASVVDKPGFDIGIDKWKMNATSWSISSSGFNVHKGVLKTGIVDVPFTGLTVLPDKLHDNAKYNASNITLNGIADVAITGDLTFGYDNGKSKWSLMATPKNDTYAAILQNLPVIKANEGFRLSSLALLSDGAVNIMVDKNAPNVSVYDIASFKATGMQVTNDAVTVIGELDHKIPSVEKISSGIVFKKAGSKVVGDILPGAINFSTNSVAISIPTDNQTFTAEKFESLGKVGQVGKFLFDIKLTHTKNAAIISLLPNQKFVLAEGKNSSLQKLVGKMEVKNGSWTDLTFEGDLNGTEGATGKLTFKVTQELKAENQSISIKNVDLPFGNIALVYNFDEQRLEGNLHFDKKVSPSQHAKGDATVLVDNSGWSFLATGKLTQTNPNLEGQAGLLFGDYPMTPDIIQRFQSTSYVYQKANHLPDIFPTVVKGFYFEGGVALPVPLIPNVDFNFGLVSGHLYVKVGGDIRAKMEFGKDKIFGIGQSIFVDAGVGLGGSVVIACAGCSANIMGMQNYDGQISTNGDWFVDGEGLLTLKGTAYKGWGVCDSDCDGMFCDKSSGSASVTFGVNAHYGTDYKELKFYIK